METNPLVQGISIKRPPHDELPVQARPVDVVATWQVGTFVENLSVGPDDEIYVSIESLGEVQRLVDGAKTTFARPGGSVTGLAMLDTDVCVSVGQIGKTGWAVHRYSPDGKELAAVNVPDALFLNGSTLLRRQTLLVADSIVGRIYWVDFTNGRSGVWSEHELFHKVTDEPMLPGINGLRVSSRSAYFTNTDRALIGRIDVNADGSAGSVQTVAERIVGDDFAIAADGSLLVTNHVYNTLTHLHPSGTRVAIAGPDQHMQGCTSVAFGRTARTERSVFVTTTGGILAPYEGMVREAKMLRLDVDIGPAVVGMTEYA